MKTGLTIQQMAQELLRQSKAKQDYLVNTGSLSLSVTSDAPQLRVTENGLDKIAPLDIRQTAHRQLGTYLGIPQKYYELMRTDAPELLAYNANYWFSQKNELRTLRTMDGCARAFLSNRYRRIDNLDIASVTLPVIGELPEARFVSTQITDDFMYIKVVNPRLQADVVPGDVVQAGVIISNSETGLGSVISPLVSFFSAKSMPYFLAVAEKARIFWSVISMLETPVLCFISCRRVCFPWCSLVLWPVTPFCISSSTFFMACCSIPAESLVASTQRATVRWVTSSCISHHLLSPPPYRSWFTRDA